MRTPSSTPQPRSPAHRLMVWLITGCAQVPRCHGTTLRFFDARALIGCARCGYPKEPVAHQIGSSYCRRCVRVVLRHHLLAEHQPSSTAPQS